MVTVTKKNMIVFLFYGVEYFIEKNATKFVGITIKQQGKLQHHMEYVNNTAKKNLCLCKQHLKYFMPMLM